MVSQGKHMAAVIVFVLAVCSVQADHGTPAASSSFQRFFNYFRPRTSTSYASYFQPRYQAPAPAPAPTTAPAPAYVPPANNYVPQSISGYVPAQTPPSQYPPRYSAFPSYPPPNDPTPTYPSPSGQYPQPSHYGPRYGNQYPTPGYHTGTYPGHRPHGYPPPPPTPSTCDDHSCKSNECCEFNGVEKKCVEQQNSVCQRFKRCSSNRDCPDDHCCVVSLSNPVLTTTAAPAYGFHYGHGGYGGYGHKKGEKEVGECLLKAADGDACRRPIDGMESSTCPCATASFKCEFDPPDSIVGTCPD